MNYTVVWKPDAEAELAEFWMNSADRRSLAAAANRLETLLADEPLNAGEGRSGTTRIVFDGHLGLVFDESEADRLVTVLQILIFD